MEVHMINKDKKRIVLLDDQMRLVKSVNSYLDFLRLRRLSENTIIAYARDLKLYMEFLQKYDYSLDEVDANIMMKFLKEIQITINREGNVIVLPQEKTRCAKSVNRILSSIHGFYKYLDITEKNLNLTENIPRPTLMYKAFLFHIRKYQETEKYVMKVKNEDREYHLITDYEAKTVYDEMSTKRDKLIMKILLNTGARIGEVLNLRIKDIPIPNDETVAVIYNIKSKGKRRNLYMPMNLLEEIDDFILNERSKYVTNHDYLFIDIKEPYCGKQLSYQSIYKIFKRITKKYNFNFTLHDYRHRFVSYLVEKGLDMSIVQLIAGHAHITTTEIYTHISKEYVVKSMSEYWKMINDLEVEDNGKY